MKTSESITSIAPALLKAQKAIKFASKDAKNPHFKNTYADLPAVIDAVKSALNDNGIMFAQSATDSDPTYLRLTTRLIHESGEWVEDTCTMPLAKNDPQGYGAAMTYARRYCLAALVGLYQDDDDGNTASGTKSGALSEKQQADISALADEVGLTIADICSKAKVSKLSDLASDRYDGLVRWLKSQREAA